MVALQLGRQFLGFELQPAYIDITNKRIAPFLAQQKLNTFQSQDTKCDTDPSSAKEADGTTTLTEGAHTPTTSRM